jgi:hypothetical protein
MAPRTAPGTDLKYHLVSFDENGKERPTAQSQWESEAIMHALADKSASITDVCFVVHGWKGDFPEAIKQFDSWLGAMYGARGDRARASNRVFRPLVVGLHWPSQPWGDEDQPKVAESHSGLLGEGSPVEHLVATIAITRPARDAVARILAAAERQGDSTQMSLDVREAYETVFRESGLDRDVTLGDLDAGDTVTWDPVKLFEQAVADEVPSKLLGLRNFKDALLSPLRQLSFWTMKNRARSFGESGAANLLARIMDATDPTVRLHLTGHSFGCIVASAAVQSAPTFAANWRPVGSLLLIQGALSLWAFARSVPDETASGYFHPLMRDQLVAGPIVATLSIHDNAVGKYYPIGARLRSQALLASFPKYGGIGTFGLQGVDAVPIVVQQGYFPSYGFQPGRAYNAESSRVIAKGKGLSGAHSDIASPEIAHLAWELIVPAKS